MRTQSLLSRNIRPFLGYVLIVFLISIPVYYFVIDRVWQEELDEHNKAVAFAVQHNLNRSRLSEADILSAVNLLNLSQTGSSLRPVLPGDDFKDRMYNGTREVANGLSSEPERFRYLSTVIYVRKKPYRFTTQFNIEESGSTVSTITAVSVFFCLITLVGSLILTKAISQSVWKPFRLTLSRLKTFNLSEDSDIRLETTNVREFEELHSSLKDLIAKNVKIFRSQKEFTENASHELQTPLAIIKNKLDLLMQTQPLTQEQYRLIQESFFALGRISRINKNLLLLAKIEGGMFKRAEQIEVGEIVRDISAQLQEQMNSAVKFEISCEAATVNGDRTLLEVMVNNLLLNAVRYSPPGATIGILLEPHTLAITNPGSAPLGQKQLFTRFAPAGSGGSGLGLSIVERIVQFHHWRIDYLFGDSKYIFTVHFG